MSLATLLSVFAAVGFRTPAHAATVPFDPILSASPIDGYGFDSQVTAGYAIEVCYGGVRPGTQAAYNYIDSVFGWPTTGTTYSCREMFPRASNPDCNGTVANPVTQPYFYSTCWSNHAQGRAMDFMVQGNAPAPEPLARGNSLVTWLLEADSSGNRNARARRLGVQQIIWNGRCWRSSNTSDRNVVTAPTMRNCGDTSHFNHVHVDFSLLGSSGLTSAYTGASQLVRRTRFADIDGDGRGEIVSLHTNGDVRAYRNQGWDSTKVYDGPNSRIVGLGFTDPTGTHFADIDGDGRDEIITMYANGDVYAFRNQGWDATNVYDGPNHKVIAQGFTDPARTKFADIDGDGRAELIAMFANGEVLAYRNQGWDATKVYDGPNHKLVGLGFTDPAGTQFADIDGDGRAEIITMYANGDVYAFRNQGWDATKVYDGPNHKVVAYGFTEPIRTHFADIDGDNLAELISVHATGDVYAYRNQGWDATKVYDGPNHKVVALGFTTP